MQGLAAGTHTAIFGLEIAAASHATLALLATGNAGSLRLVGCRIEADMIPPGAPLLPDPGALLRFVDCRDVVLHDCTVTTNLAFTEAIRSRLRLQSSTLSSTMRYWWGPSYLYNPAGPPALVLAASEARLVSSSLFGTGGYSTTWYWNPVTTGSPPGPAARIDAASRLVCGPDSHLRAGVNTTTYAYPLPITDYNFYPSVQGGGQVVADPACLVEGNFATPHRIERIHETRVSPARLGEVADVGVASEPNALALVAVSWRPNAPIATGLGELWLDVPSLHVLGVGVLDPAGRLAFPMPLTVGEPFTLQFAAQAFLLLPNGTFTLASPAFSANLPIRG